MTATPKIAVLVSGTGTIMAAMLKQGLPIAVVIADRPCPGLGIAAAHNVPTVLIDRAEYNYSPRRPWNREGFTAAVMRELDARHVELVAMAGFMTIFSAEIFIKYENRILNTHPSLLPAFKGAHAVPQALASGVAETGCTVHIATAELDSGHILAQQRVPVLPGDTPDSLQERIKVVERKLYPATIMKYVAELPSLNQPIVD